VVKTALSNNFFNAGGLRHQLWHPRDFSGVHCAIRDAEAILGWDNIDDAKYPTGKNWEQWGSNIPFPTGKAAMLYIHTAIEDQVKWLQRKKPSVLLTFPSNLREIVKYCAQEGIRFENLKTIDTISEVLAPDLRDAVREVWGLTITDMYSAAEIGYIALQCPEFEHYHIQSEIVHVEILDENHRPCEPGQTGRVVVTPLHNVATPLIRYEVGDFAEAGAPCPCGRGLPVIKQVFGRVRNMLHYPNGNQVWPNFGWEDIYVNDSVKRFQVIQKTLEKIEVRLVCRSPLNGGDEDLIRQRLRKTLEYPFEIDITYHETLERSRSGKFEDFKSELAAPSSQAA
jgi:phenylacetate-CoA ligase